MAVNAELQAAPQTGPNGGVADPAPRALWVAFACLGVLLAAYLVYLLGRTNWNFSPVLDGWGVVAFEAAASVLCLARGFVRRAHWRVALIMGAACLSWTFGDVAFTIESLRATPAVPSLADLFYLAFFPLAFVALVLYTRGAVDRGKQLNWLDGAIAALGMAAICSGVAFHGLEKLVEGSSLGAATTLAYPVGDLLLLGIVAGASVVVSGRMRATLLMLGVGMAVNAAGDTFNFIGSTSTTGSIVNGIAWPTSILIFAMSMWVGEGRSPRLTLERLSGLVLPTFVTCSSLAILVVGNARHLGPLAVGLATVTLILMGVRLAYRPALSEARQKLRSSEDRYQMLFEQNPQPMVAYDRETYEILAANEAMIDKTGYSREELEAMLILDFLPEDRGARLRAFVETHPDGARPADFRDGEWGELGHQRLKDGTLIDVEITSNNVLLDGRECRIAIFVDVTERNRTARELAVARDRAVEASNMKSAFLANMSHEIRTPMNGVIGMNDLLLASELTEEQRGYAQQVARSGDQMLALIHDILDIAKLEAGHIELDPSDFNLHELIEQACSIAVLQTREKGLQFELTIEQDVPERVRGDARRLQQVILNLVTNAVKFTADGAVRVRASSPSRSAAGARVGVEVADTGVGIDSGALERMFEPFTQADVSTTRLYGGTGLGLAIVRELVELMGGTVRAESELGRGSKFSFELVLATPASAELPAPRGTARTASEVPFWTNEPLVLVVEDSPVNQIVAARALELCGCQVEIVADGYAALRALDAHDYDLVLMDCQMPGLDGYEATVELRRREGGSRRTPVVAMTAHAMDQDRERCLAAGMDDYLSKPMRHEDLARTLSRWIPPDAPRSAGGPDLSGEPRLAANG